MLHHVSVGVADVERAAKFYDAVLGALGYKRIMEYMPYALAYGETAPSFWVQLPHNQQAASAGNGTHIGFSARSKVAIDAFHRAALEHGGTDNGEPGPRPDYGAEYYGAFVIDLDGNKLEATLHAEPKAKRAARKPRAKKAAQKRAAPRRAAKKAKKAKRGPKRAKAKRR
ncbi:MAG TPA: VOC family protein [Rhizomicrobium sp.]|nr:VOC family protein [Rhizomicrobium sp.]